MSQNNVWEQIHKSKSWGRYPNEELVRFIGRNFFKYSIPERKNIKILEIGCGQGANIWFLAKEGFDSYGIDISISAIEKANKYLNEFHHTSANLEQGDAKNLQYSDNYFDAVIDVVALQHLTFTDHKIAYNEVKRVLKSNGLFWTMHIAKNSFGYGTGRQIDYETFTDIKEGPFAGKGQVTMLDQSDMKKVITESNLEIISLEKQINTYNNLKDSLIHWLITCKTN